MGRVFQLIQSNKVYSGEFSVNVNKFRVNGLIMKKEFIEYADSVGILPVDKHENLLLIQQFRFATFKTITEIPAGKIEKGESPEQAALREMNEEIGYSGKTYSNTTVVLGSWIFYRKNASFLCHRLKKNSETTTYG